MWIICVKLLYWALTLKQSPLDDMATIDNISKDINIGLVLSKLLEFWTTFILIHSIIAALSKLLIKIHHEDIWQQKGHNAQLVATTISINSFQRYSKHSVECELWSRENNVHLIELCTYGFWRFSPSLKEAKPPTTTLIASTIVIKSLCHL